MTEDKSKKLKHYTDQLASTEDKKNQRAIALRYDTNKDRAPKILASGKGAFAQELLKIAEENNVPMYEDPTLANLLSKLDIDSEIPPELFTVVAEVLAFVYQLDKMSKKREKLRRKFAK